MKAMSQKAKKTIKLVTDIVFWVFFAFALAFTVLAFTAQSSPTGYPTIGNKMWLTVESTSMTGTFNEGDLITVRAFTAEEVDAEKRHEEIKSEVQIGDVITFTCDIDKDGIEELNSHKVVDIDENNGYIIYQTKGDANDAVDAEWVYETRVIGKWTGKRLAGFGNFISFLQPPHAGFFVFIIVPLAGFLGYEVYVLVVNIKRAKGGDKRTITKADEELIKQQAIEEFLKKQEAEKNKQSE